MGDYVILQTCSKSVLYTNYFISLSKKLMILLATYKNMAASLYAYTVKSTVAA